MFGRKRHRNVKVDTIIGGNTRLKGDVSFSGGLHVDGIIQGDVIAREDPSALTLSQCGRIEGNIRVERVTLNGTVIGDVTATECIQLMAHARVTGNVHYRLLEMAMGAEVNGIILHQDQGERQEDEQTAQLAGVQPVMAVDNS